MSDTFVYTLAALALLWTYLAIRDRHRPTKAKGTDTNDSGRPDPPASASQFDGPVDINRITEKFAYYSSSKRTFVVFKHGTCVTVPDTSTDPAVDAAALLRPIATLADFNVHPMDDGHYTVSYKSPACSILFADEVKRDNLLGQPPHAHLLIGLVGRARMYLDAESPHAIRTWRPTTTP